MNKPITLTALKDLINQYDKEDITLSRFKEILNEIALQWHSEQSGWVKCSDRLPTKEDESPVSKELLSDVDYWKQRCLLAEKCIEESPCDPDVTVDQIKAHNAYHKFISWAGRR